MFFIHSKIDSCLVLCWIPFHHIPFHSLELMPFAIFNLYNPVYWAVAIQSTWHSIYPIDDFIVSDTTQIFGILFKQSQYIIHCGNRQHKWQKWNNEQKHNRNFLLKRKFSTKYHGMNFIFGFDTANLEHSPRFVSNMNPNIHRRC